MQERPEEAVKRISREEYEREIAQLKYCLEIGKEAYAQENTRTETLKMRTENIVKYSTVFVAIANLVVSLVDKGALGVSVSLPVKALYIGLMAAIIVCIILALIAQRPVLTEMFPDGVWMLEEVRSHQDEYQYENERIYELVLRYAGRTRTMKKNNDISFKLVTASYVLYILSIILLAVLLVVTLNV